MSDNSKFIKGTIVGAVIGAVAGILFAPKSGKETRADIKKNAQKARKEADKRLKELHQELSRVTAEAKKKYGRLTGQAKREAETALTNIIRIKDAVKQEITDIRNGESQGSKSESLEREATKAKETLKKSL